MTGTVQRLSLAAFVSAFGIVATNVWYRATAPLAAAGGNGAEPIAYVESGAEDVERKPGSRLIWESVKDGETLFTRDTIRAEGRPTKLKMIDSGAIIELAPNSVIVMSKSQGKVSLDLIDGGVTLKHAGNGAKSGAGTLEVKVGGTKLATGSKPLEMSIRKGASGKVSVAVVKGTAAASNAGKSFAVEAGKAGNLSSAGLSTEDVLQVTYPPPGAAVDIGSGTTPVTVKWRAIDRAYSVHAEVSEGAAWHAAGSAVAGDAGGLAVPFGAGPHQWRLVATKASAGKGMTSVDYALRAVLVQPPELTAPAAGARIEIRPGHSSIRFAWLGTERFTKYELRVGKDAALHEVVVTKLLGSDGEAAVEVGPPGSYFWQVVGVGESDGRRLGSPVRPLVLTPPAALDVRLVSPEDGQHFKRAVGTSGVLLKWSADAAASRFRLQVERLDTTGAVAVPAPPETAGHEQLIRSLAPGIYRWSVRTVSEGDASASAKPRTFVIEDLAKLAWTLPANDTLEADSIPPKVQVSWARSPAGTTSWRLAASTDPNAARPNWHLVHANALSLTLPKPGFYYLDVEALDAQGQVVGSAAERRLEIKAPTKLPPPRLKTQAAKIEADGNGNAHAEWHPVNGATGYVAVLAGKDGNIVLHKEGPATRLDMRDLMPGQYVLAIKTLSQAKEASDTATRIFVEVPSVSAVIAPAVHVDIK